MFVLDIQDIRENYDNGFYRAKFPEHIKKEDLTKLSENFIFDEELSVRRNKELVEEHNKRVDEIMAAQREKQLELNKKLTESVVAYIKYNYNLSDLQARKVEAFVYSEHHSFMCDYFSNIDTYANFADNIVNED